MCHTMHHFTCVEKWSSRTKHRRRNKTLELKGRTWKCPGCPHLYELISEPYCWCGKTKHADGVEFLGLANSCPSFCGKPTKCDHTDTFCQRLCHPGPCPTLCNQECEGKQAVQDEQRGFWGRVKQRLKQRNYSAEELHEVLILSAIVIVLYIITAGVLWWDIQWFTRPDLYLKSHRHWWKLECGLFITFLVFCWVPLFEIFSTLFQTRELVVVAFDLKGNRGKRWLKNIGTMIMVPIWLTIYAAPIVW